MDKPVAYFRGPVRFLDGTTDEGEDREFAIVEDVTHPVLGLRPVVWTSAIEVKCEDGDSFETLNTLYKRERSSGSGDYNAGCMNGPC